MLREGELKYLGDPSSWTQVGAGSYGTVYRAPRRDGKGDDAVKVMPTTDPDDRKAVQLEVRILRELDSPHIVKYRNCVKSGDDALWVVMEFCAGGSVDAVVGMLTESQIAWVCRDALLGLEYLHGRGVIHRDVKGGNLLIDHPGGRVKLADFGVSAKLATPGSLRRTLIGTCLWMAPEVIAAGEDGYDTSAVVWSLGVTAIELAEGAPPHFRRQMQFAMHAILRGPVPRLRRRRRVLLHCGFLPGSKNDMSRALHGGVMEDGHTAGFPAWSDSFDVFVNASLTKQARLRPGATALLREAFPSSAPPPGDPDAGGLLAAVALARQQKAEAAARRRYSPPPVASTTEAGGERGAAGSMSFRAGSMSLRAGSMSLCSHATGQESYNDDYDNGGSVADGDSLSGSLMDTFIERCSRGPGTGCATDRAAWRVMFRDPEAPTIGLPPAPPVFS